MKQEKKLYLETRSRMAAIGDMLMSETSSKKRHSNPATESMR
jgi:hypothetical protein